MTIDTERLKTDAAYWDKCGAPEGATHLDLDFDYFCNEKGFWNNSMEWRPTPHGHADWGSGRYIPRPTKPAAPVLVEYPTGTGRLIVPEPDNNGVVIVLDESGEYRRVSECNIKPLRTPEQRQREELVDIICSQGFLSRDGNVSWEIADVVIEFYKERYNLEPKL